MEVLLFGEVCAVFDAAEALDCGGGKLLLSILCILAHESLNTKSVMFSNIGKVNYHFSFTPGFDFPKQTLMYLFAFYSEPLCSVNLFCLRMCRDMRKAPNTKRSR